MATIPYEIRIRYRVNHGSGNFITKSHPEFGLWKEIIIYRSANSPEQAARKVNKLERGEIVSIRKAIASQR